MQFITLLLEKPPPLRLHERLEIETGQVRGIDECRLDSCYKPPISLLLVYHSGTPLFWHCLLIYAMHLTLGCPSLFVAFSLHFIYRDRMSTNLP